MAVHLTKNELAAIETQAQRDYKLLKRKYEKQAKDLERLMAEEKMALRDEFKGVGAGRKRKYTPNRMKNRIIDYFAKIIAMNRPPSKSGLMAHLKMHRDQFYTYASYPEFKDIMEQTSLMIENWYEEALILNKYSGSGIQFALKNRFGWADTQVLRVENLNDEQSLIRKIESLAPELVGFFQVTIPAVTRLQDVTSAITLVDKSVVEADWCESSVAPKMEVRHDEAN
jgi:hypothetical protein